MNCDPPPCWREQALTCTCCTVGVPVQPAAEYDVAESVAFVVAGQLATTTYTVVPPPTLNVAQDPMGRPLAEEVGVLHAVSEYSVTDQPNTEGTATAATKARTRRKTERTFISIEKKRE